MKQVLYFVASRGFQTPDIPETRGRLDGSPPPPVSRLGGSVVGGSVALVDLIELPSLRFLAVPLSGNSLPLPLPLPLGVALTFDFLIASS
jgi:hypothetical protein